MAGLNWRGGLIGQHGDGRSAIRDGLVERNRGTDTQARSAGFGPVSGTRFLVGNGQVCATISCNILRYQQAFCWTEEIIVTIHLRNAAGVCALSIGLLVCSSAGAIATADETETGTPTTGTQGVSATGEGTNTTTSTSTGPTSTVGNQRVDVETSVGGTTTTGTTTTSTNGQGPTSTVSAQTNTSGDNKDGTGASALEAKTNEVGATANSTTNTSESKPAAAAHTSPAGSSGASTSAPGIASKTSAPVTPKPVQITNTVVVPVTNAVITLAQGFGTASLTLLSLPGSKTPITDVITAVQIMLSAVVDAVVEVAQVPGNLASLFGVAAYDARPPLIGTRGALDTVARGPVDLPLLGTAGPLLPIGAVEAPMFGNVIHTSNIGAAATTGLKNELSLSGLAPVPSGVSPATTSFLDHIVRSVLVPASLTALAAIAVPGIGGLLIVCAAGIRVGYRQAKAGLALRASGIARFAGPGPMGVVRSGSLIALHSRTPRLGKPSATRAAEAKAAHAPRLLESVA